MDTQNLIGFLQTSKSGSLDLSFKLAKFLGDVPKDAQVDSKFPRDPETAEPSWNNGKDIFVEDYDGGFFNDYTQDLNVCLGLLPDDLEWTLKKCYFGTKYEFVINDENGNQWISVAHKPELAVCAAFLKLHER